MKHEDIRLMLSNEEYVGKEVTICGWVKAIRKSKNMCFLEINDGTSLKNLQLVIDYTLITIEDLFNKLNIGSSVAVKGIIVSSINQNQKIELNVKEIKLLGECSNDYPIQRKRQNMEYLRNYPHLRTRTNTFNAAFRIRSMLIKYIHDYFQEHNFIYVNTPIITGSNCEGAGEMFRVTTYDLDKLSKNSYDANLNSKDFFGKRVSLTVSGQLEAEAMACSLGKVYSFGPSFRAENSNTKKHAAEFWLFEPEMAFTDLYEAVDVANELLKNVFKRILCNCSQEIDFFTNFYDNNLLDKLNNVVESDFSIIDYSEAINILHLSGIDFEFPVYWGCDLKSEHIRYLTDVVFKRPIYIINYPRDLKPFYIKTNTDGKTVASADLYFPGIGDIIGVCQKEDNFELLNQRIKELKMTEEDYYWYLDLRKYGTVPHSGFGLGIERLVMYTTGLDNIRDTICFPRTKCKKLKL